MISKSQTLGWFFFLFPPLCLTLLFEGSEQAFIKAACSCCHHYKLAQAAQIANSVSGQKINFAIISWRPEYAASPTFQWQSLCFLPLFLILAAAVPCPPLLLPGKAAVAGEAAGTVLSIWVQVTGTGDSLPGQMLHFHECPCYDWIHHVSSQLDVCLKKDSQYPKPSCY